MAAIRLFVRAPGGERVYDFDGDEVVVGRDASADVRLEDRRASRRHCRLFRAADGWRAVDLESRNGTTLNGGALADEPLAEGDHVVVGQVTIAVSFPSPREDDAFATVGAHLSLGPGGLGQGASLEPDAGTLDRGAPSARGGVQREVRALEHLIALERRISATDDEDALLDAILDAAIELLGAGRGLLLLAAGDHVVVRRARKPGRLDLEDPEASLSVTVARTAIRERRTVVTDDAVSDARFERADSIIGLALRSVVCVPLDAGEEALGAIYVDDADRPGAFDARDVALLEAFGAQAALALRHCRQRREAVERRREAVKQARRVERLNERLRKVLRRRTSLLRQAREDLAKQQDELGLKYRYDQIVGASPAMRDVLRLVDRVTDLTLPVLVIGESGTGKELIARAIHFNGPRRRARIVGENCGAVPESLMESEFFGYARGAFTGAVRDHPGLFEQADKGTLFLDEVGEMAQEMQKKLLRVLEEGEVRRVGGKAAVPVDVRIVSATNRDLSEMLADGRFREDLYYRLAGVVIELPPLRDRRDDVEPLAAHFLAEAAPAGSPLRVDAAATELLIAYDWPGNVRELRNEMRRVAALNADGVVRPEHLSARITAYRPPDPERVAGRDLRGLVEDLERRVLRSSLLRHGWNKSRAAVELGLSRLGLRKKLERYRLDEEQPPDGRAVRTRPAAGKS